MAGAGARVKRDPLEPFAGVRYKKRALYDAPESYDLDYAGYTAELPFYRMLIREHVRQGCCYVELGAGTGRLVIPFAREGAHVLAVEPSRGMRRQLQAKLRREGPSLAARVHIDDGDAASFRAPAAGRPTLVSLPFNAVLHLETREALLRSFAHVRELLDPQGCFALDMTGPSWLVMSVGGLGWGRSLERTDPKSGRRVLTCDQTRYHPGRKVLESTFRFVEEGARAGLELTLEQRMWTWQEVLHALDQCGFHVERAFGDVDFAPFSEKSPRLLVAAVPR